MKGNLSAENAFIWLYFMMDFMMDSMQLTMQ